VTPASPDGWRTLARALFDITQLLESADGASRRVRRVLEFLRGLVPYEQCAILEVHGGDQPRVVIVPEVPTDRRVLMTQTLLNILGQLVETSARPDTPLAPQEGVYLAVPLVGLDEVIGLLFVRSSVAEYTEDHLRTLAVVAAKLGSYFTMLRAQAELADLFRERDQARLIAEGANQAKDEFLALVSNELKAPLGAILASTHVLRSPDTTTAARTRALDAIDRSVGEQVRRVEDVLDLAHMASSERRLNLSTIEPAALIKTTIERLRPEAERKSIQLEADLEATGMPLVLDQVRIGRVVSILVANAINCTPAGGHVGVQLERAADCARIRVSDSGIGIASEVLAHVFDRSRRRSGARPRAREVSGKGLGVGLAIVKDIVELHGGHVRAESAGPEQGATFTVELPLLPPPRLSLHLATVQPYRADSGWHGRRRRRSAN
jgi:signal transduction histidine kinase